MRVKYTKELLAPIVTRSTSYSQVIRALGLMMAGGTHWHISRKIRAFELDTSHFLGRGSNSGANHKGGPSKKAACDILVLRDTASNPEKGYRLRKALLDIGTQNQCAVCNIGCTWNGRHLTLQVDHKNGKAWDCRPTNLRLMCPNCHSQTDTFCRNNRHKPFTAITLEPTAGA